MSAYIFIPSVIISGLLAIGGTVFILRAFRMRGFAVILGATSFLALILFLTTVSSYSFGLRPGGIERMIVYPNILWMICFGGCMMASTDRK